MDPKEKIIEDFKKYITGVYLLQQEFIDDIESGLKAVIEQYHIEFSSKDNVEVTLKEVPKKEEVKPSSSQNTPLPHEEEEEVPEEEQTENFLSEQDQQMVPQSVIDTLANKEEEKGKKKAGRKTGSKNKDPGEIKKKRLLTPYTLYVKENSKRIIKENSDIKLSQKERMEILGKEWVDVKQNPEKYNYYLDLTKEKNKEQIEENEKIEN